MLRNKKLIKITGVVILVAFLAMSVLSVLPMFSAGAETAQERLEKSRQEQEAIKGQIADTEQAIEENMAAKDLIDQEIAVLQAEIDVINQNIADTNDKIAEKEKELEIAEKECDDQYTSYCTRAEILLEKGSVTYLEIVLRSDSFEDFLTRAALVQEIAEYDNNKLKELQKYAAKVASLKQELENEKASLEVLKSEADSQMAALEEKRAASQAIIDTLQADMSSFEAALAAQEKAEAAAKAEIARLAAENAKKNGPVTAYTGGAFHWPSVSTYITSEYGTRTHPITGRVKYHAGIDIGAAHGTDIYAAEGGVVLVSGWNTGGYGNYVVIDHGSGITTLYAHCSSLLVSAGQTVTRGQVIAKCGSTGMSTGPHLHFEVLKNGSATDPMAFFN